MRATRSPTSSAARSEPSSPGTPICLTACVRSPARSTWRCCRSGAGAVGCRGATWTPSGRRVPPACWQPGWRSRSTGARSPRPARRGASIRADRPERSWRARRRSCRTSRCVSSHPGRARRSSRAAEGRCASSQDTGPRHCQGRAPVLGYVVMDFSAADDAPAAPAAEPSLRHRRLAFVLIGIASLLAVLAILALWANRQLLNTDNWTDTSSELLENDAIRNQTAVFLVDQLYANVDVQAQLAAAFPVQAKPLAGPAAGALKDLAVRGTDALLARPRPQRLWEEANRRAHTRFIDVIEGGGDVVSTEGGDVTLDLKALLGQTADRVGVGGRAEARIPADAAQITVMKSDNLELAQDGVRVLRASAIVILMLGLYALAVFLAVGWRREALRATGFGLLLAGIAALVARSLAGDAVVDSLASTAAVQPAADAAWSISTSLMVEAASAAIAYGVVLIGAAWLAGPTASATATRRALAPYLREPRLAYGALAVIVLLLLAWGPTPALRRAVPALVLAALLALGVEMLRRQVAREFPDASREESVAHMRERAARIGRWARGAARSSGAPGDGAVAADRLTQLEQLERLGRLRDAHVLDASEFEREKQQILASGAQRSQ